MTISASAFGATCSRSASPHPPSEAAKARANSLLRILVDDDRSHHLRRPILRPPHGPTTGTGFMKGQQSTGREEPGIAW